MSLVIKRSRAQVLRIGLAELMIRVIAACNVVRVLGRQEPIVLAHEVPASVGIGAVSAVFELIACCDEMH